MTAAFRSFDPYLTLAPESSSSFATAGEPAADRPIDRYLQALERGEQ